MVAGAGGELRLVLVRFRAAMRISVSNWSTDADDVDRSVEAILRCVSDSLSTP